MPIKVLFIHHCATPGGASTSLINLLKYLPPERIEKYVITPKGNVADFLKPHAQHVFELSTRSVASYFPSAEGIPFLVPKSFVHYIRYYPSLHEIIAIAGKVKPDIIHINDIPLIPSAISLSKLGFPVVMHARTAPGRKPGLFDRLQRNWINKYVDKLICISESVRQGFSDIRHAEVVYNPMHTQLQEKRRKPLTQDEVMNCLFLSNFLLYKGIYETLDAAVLLKNNPAVHFYIAGANIRSARFDQSPVGRLLDWFCIAQNIDRRLKARIRKHRLRNITMLGHVDDIDALLRTMHVNLAPVRLNAPPRSVFEAAMHQAPTILSLTDIVEDLVRHEETGLIIEPRSPQAIADAILRLRNNEQLRNTMGWNAMHKLTQQHDPVRGAERIIGIYQEILEAKSVRTTNEVRTAF